MKVNEVKQERQYQQKRQMVTEFMRRRKTTDHSFILNDIDISYGTLMKILSELHNYAV
jgi:biopolymer transport protein ExbD